MKFSQFFFQFCHFFLLHIFWSFEIWKKKKKTKSIVQILCGYFIIMKHYPPVSPQISALCLSSLVLHRDFYFVILTCASCDSLFRQRYFVFSLLSDKCFYLTAYTNWWKSVVIITGFQCTTLLCPSHLPDMTWAFLC